MNTHIPASAAVSTAPFSPTRTMPIRWIFLLRRFWQALLILLLGLSGAAQAGTLNLTFSTGVNVAGGGACALIIGSQCRYSNVVQGSPPPGLQRDAIVTVVSFLGGASLATPFDNDAVAYSDAGGAAIVGPHPEVLAPIVVAPDTPNTTSGVLLRITFYAAGTSTVLALPGTVFMTSSDTDTNGTVNGLREYIEYRGFSGTGLPATTNLQTTVTANGTQYAVRPAAAAPNTYSVNGITVNPAYRASARYDNPTQIDFLVGSIQGTSADACNTTAAGGTNACNRLGAYSFLIADSSYTTPLVDVYKSVKLTTDADGTGSITPGDTLTYTVTAVNTGNAAVTNFQLTDTLPDNVTITSTGAQTVKVGGTAGATNTSYTGLATANTLLAASQTLAANGTISVDIPVIVGTVSTATPLSNQATASGTGMSSINSDNVDATTSFTPSTTAATGWAAVPAGSVAQTQADTVNPTTATITPAANLAITKTDGVGSVNAGSSTTYTLRVTNTGPSSVTGATLTDASVAGLTVTSVACSGTPGQCTTAPTIAQLQAGYALPALASGQVYELTVTGTVTATSGTVANTATIAAPSGTTDPTPGNNSATDTDTVNPVADLSLSKTDNVGSFHVGSVLTYTVVVGNAGPSTATGATVSDPLPSGIPAANMSYTAAVSGGATTGVTGTRSGALNDTVTLPVGGTVTYTITVTVPTTYPGGTLVNTATVTAPGGTTDPVTTNNTATDTDTREAPVANDDSASTDPLVAVTFNITGNDLGPVDPATVDLDPGTPGQQTTITDTGKGSYSVDSSGNVTFSPASGFVLGTSTITYTVKDALGVSSGAATIRVSVPAAADLAATKTGPAYAQPGEAITYTITVSNKTGVPAGAYTVTDTLAPGLTFVGASDGGTYDSATRTVTWSLLSLTGSGQQLLTVTATAPSAAQIAGGIRSVQNTATVSLTGDPTSANNTSGTVTTGLILSEITKRVRNVTTNTAFGTSGSGMPKQVLEYCLDARNLGGVDLGAPTGYRVRDLLPVNVSALLTAYDSAPTATGTGNGVQVTRGAAAPTYLKSSVATLTDTNLNVNLGVVTAGETVTVCFQATIR